MSDSFSVEQKEQTNLALNGIQFLAENAQTSRYSRHRIENTPI
jgi:hypothetical protein